jgi:hypothetical protein
MYKSMGDLPLIAFISNEIQGHHECAEGSRRGLHGGRVRLREFEPGNGIMYLQIRSHSSHCNGTLSTDYRECTLVGTPRHNS